ncbi:acetylornithine and succinylornithine aminotransferase [Rhodopirellula sallentina SM41]|uniref:Acetylornithine and succinylornithine aminotransferase n=1 Tax=Rhodopirellula sallentina SM41 TaxID=1263870 RepID=M5TUN1_9BACT|nr:acetylornithine and succinylornithine aminotransferase [Rhodopirellula sallentina SM41]
MVGRMASGRADLRETASPLVPGFVHSPLDGLAQRIDGSIAMVLLSPVDLFDQVRAVSAEQFAEIRAACDQHGVALVIDHQSIPPMGGGYFWVHDSITSVNADAVIMAAGLTGGFGGGVLALNAELSEQLMAPTFEHSDMPIHIPTAVLVDATLRQWSEQSWQSRELDSFATSLAERLAKRESVRDLHVMGRCFGIELDLPAAQWHEYADRFGLRVATAGEFAVRMQLPLIIDDEAETELLDRMDRVFDEIEEHERKSAEPTSNADLETDQDTSETPDADDTDSEEPNEQPPVSPNDAADFDNAANFDNAGDFDDAGDDAPDDETDDEFEEEDEADEESFDEDDSDADEVEESDVDDSEVKDDDFEEENELDEDGDEDALEQEFEDKSDDEESDFDELDDDESGDDSDDEETDDDNFDEDVDANDDDDDEVKRSQFDGEIAERETEDSDSKTDPENQS